MTISVSFFKPTLVIPYEYGSRHQIDSVLLCHTIEYLNTIHGYTYRDVYVYMYRQNKIINNYLSLVIIYPIFYCKRLLRLLHCSFIYIFGFSFGYISSIFFFFGSL